MEISPTDIGFTSLTFGDISKAHRIGTRLIKEVLVLYGRDSPYSRGARPMQKGLAQMYRTLILIKGRKKRLYHFSLSKPSYLRYSISIFVKGIQGVTWEESDTMPHP